MRSPIWLIIFRLQFSIVWSIIASTLVPAYKPARILTSVIVLQDTLVKIVKVSVYHVIVNYWLIQLYVTSHHITPFHTIPEHTIPYFTTPCHIKLYYTIYTNNKLYYLFKSKQDFSKGFIYLLPQRFGQFYCPKKQSKASSAWLKAE
jgi:hypothetical protein